MKQIFILLITLLLLLSASNLSAHTGKPKYHVIIDTDGAIDDMRAISMLLAGNDIRVLAITCSQGSLSPLGVYYKVIDLLKAFHHEGISVGVSKPVDFPLPPWSGFAKNIIWGDGDKKSNATNSIKVLNKSIKNYKNKIILIALGSLKTYENWIKNDSSLANKIERIIWYNSHQIETGFNNKISPKSFEFFKNHNIPIEIVANKSKDLVVSDKYLTEISKSNSIYGNQIFKVHKQKNIAEKIVKKHLKLWDDLIPLYLTTPIIFEKNQEGNISYIALNKSIPQSFVNETIQKLLASSTQTNNRVFTSFPVDTSLYKAEYANILKPTLQNHGAIEWKAITMTNEIHGHTGIYSIIGAKMGIRAMEYFNVGVNNLNVITFAGNRPPLSCFNDGLQISSGATIGQGLITISDSISNIPMAIFIFNNQKIKISLNQQLAVDMRKEIKYGVDNYGLLSDKYWLYIEELAIKYWANFDRHKIFNIQKVN